MESFKSNNYISGLDKEIDLKRIFTIIIKQKKIITIFSVFGLFLGFIIPNLSEKVWQGESQLLILKKQNNFSQLLESSGYQKKLKLDNPFLSVDGNLDLKTEFQILKSFFVLEDVFQEIKNNEEFSKNELNFYDWRNSLDLYLNKNTNVLNIKYTDRNKALVKFVIDKVTDKYQRYSIEKISERIEDGKKYFEDQLNFYNKNNNSSLDLLVLDALNEQYRAILLAKDIDNKPWVLISKPQIIQKQFSSSKQILLFGLFIGFSLGLFIALFKENKLDKFYSYNEIEKYLKYYPLIDNLFIKRIDKFTKSFEYISNVLSVSPKGELGLLFIDEINQSASKKIEESSLLLSKDRNVFISNDINELNNCDNFIIFINFDLSTRKTFVQNINKLILQKKYIIGIITIK